MKIKIAVLGSCISRDIFNSHFVPNYKEFFEVTLNAQRTSIISLMQDSIEIDKNLIDIHPHNPKNNARTNFINNDLNKIFLKKLIDGNIDYLILDNYFEFLFGILYYDNKIITNNFWDLPETQFYKNMSNTICLNIYENFDEYFCIWSKYCDLFFKFIGLYCPNIKLILIQARETDKVMKSDGTSYINSEFTKTMNNANSFLEKLDYYILDNYEVNVLKFDYENTYCDEDHIWGFAPMHFHKKYHNFLFNKLKHMISEDKFKENSFNISKNFDEDLFKKELNRANFETKVLLNNIKKNNILTSLNMYNTARIDIKNYGFNNRIRIIEEELPLSTISFPKWLKSKEGEGLVIESENGTIDFRIQCINKGYLKIFLRGPNVLDRNLNRFPIYIDFINLRINNELIFNESNLVWHDIPYIFEKEVNDSEIIDIHVEWKPFNKCSVFKRK